MSSKEIDAISGTETTGHEWDGIKELNTPLPRWWLWTFYITIIWALGYTIAYPAWPLISTNTKGLLGYSSRADVARELAAAEAGRASVLQRIAETDIAGIAADEELSRFAVAAGRSAFKVYCSQCHGSGAQGAPGYPNLNDDDWLWGGTLDDIFLTINHGVRFDADDDTRISEMPAFGRDELLEPGQISAVANFVLSLSGKDHDAAQVEEGKTVYAENCASCHGDDGTGLAEFGAPNLADAIWLYGDTMEAVVAQISGPQHGVMPAWGTRLGETTVKQLAVYVHSLGGGE
ncbi:MAG: Cbb3-type cytochrome c oxidase subunit [Alphaproteobacteria bacterium]|nr:MAG: Cbb3-type cytochrome c oxidase subunit [Alphaproteobacteria bacterium]